MLILKYLVVTNKIINFKYNYLFMILITIWQVLKNSTLHFLDVLTRSNLLLETTLELQKCKHTFSHKKCTQIEKYILDNNNNKNKYALL